MHLLLPAGAKRRTHARVVWPYDNFRDDEVVESDDYLVTSRLRTLVDLVRATPFASAVTTLDAGLRAPYLLPDGERSETIAQEELQEAVARLGGMPAPILQVAYPIPGGGEDRVEGPGGSTPGPESGNGAPAPGRSGEPDETPNSAHRRRAEAGTVTSRGHSALCGRDRPVRRSVSTEKADLGGWGTRTVGAEGAGPERWRTAAASGSLGRLSARRNPGLRLRHMHNPPVAEILQPFSPKEVG
ncbi:hypothetical protein [Cryobacterium mannosilyticum]|uniref:Uncharacterized protein n=1 Tax=Cryobacterium mannosilyticum TaxID=1259190 RepID=A0A4R8W628_9MICO|nr:hypothetical protein [Cryobacterium mannosilyticum]TFC02872.1 hypothetical protein E3O32_11215 [Cryobacterium mannosilyticum]